MEPLDVVKFLRTFRVGDRISIKHERIVARKENILATLGQDKLTGDIKQTIEDKAYIQSINMRHVVLDEYDPLEYFATVGNVIEYKNIKSYEKLKRPVNPTIGL